MLAEAPAARSITWRRSPPAAPFAPSRADRELVGDRTLTVSVAGTLVLGRLCIGHRDPCGEAIEHLLLFRFGAVFVECRAQYRPVARVTAPASLERLLREIVWPPPES